MKAQEYESESDLIRQAQKELLDKLREEISWNIKNLVKKGQTLIVPQGVGEYRQNVDGYEHFDEGSQSLELISMDVNDLPYVVFRKDGNLTSAVPVAYLQWSDCIRLLICIQPTYHLEEIGSRIDKQNG